MRRSLPILASFGVLLCLSLFPVGSRGQEVEESTSRDIAERERIRSMEVETPEQEKERRAIERELIPGAEDDKATPPRESLVDAIRKAQRAEHLKLGPEPTSGFQRGFRKNTFGELLGKEITETNSQLRVQDETIFTPKPSAQCKRYFANDSVTVDENLRKPIPVTEHEKLKAVISRACMESFWPDGLGEHGELVHADKMRSLRDSVEAFSKDKVLPNDQMQAHLISRGGKRLVDVQQYLLFADFVLLQKLMGEGRFDEASKEGWRIIQQRHLKAKQVPWTTLDEVTYISSENLTNLIYLATAEARSKTPVGTATEELKFLGTYLDSRPSLVQTFGRVGKEDSTNKLVQRVANAEWYYLNEPSWTRDDKLSHLPFVLGANTDEKGLLLVLKGRQIHAIEGEGSEAKLLTGSNAARSYERALSADLKTHSTSEMRLFAVSEFGNSYEVNFGDSAISLTTQELAMLQSGKPLPDDHELSKLIRQTGDSSLVAYTNPFIFRDGKQLKASDDFAFAVAKAYPGATILTDPFSERTQEQVRKVVALGKSIGAKTVAVVADDSFAVKDYKIVQNIEDDLRKQGIDVVSVSDENIQKASIPWSESAGRLVFVITGHIDAKLATFVRALGDAGVFRDNYVLFNTCRAKLSRQLVSETATRYGAVGVNHLERMVTPEEIEQVLPKLPGNVKENSDWPFLELWRENLHEHGLNGIWTVCENFRGAPQEPA